MDTALLGAIIIACCFAAGVFADGSDKPANGRARTRKNAQRDAAQAPRSASGADAPHAAGTSENGGAYA